MRNRTGAIAIFCLSCTFWVFMVVCFIISCIDASLIAQSVPFRFAAWMPWWYWLPAAAAFALASLSSVYECSKPYDMFHGFSWRAGLASYAFFGGLLLSLLAGLLWPVALVFLAYWFIRVLPEQKEARMVRLVSVAVARENLFSVRPNNRREPF